MSLRSPEGLLERLLREAAGPERPAYLMLRAEPASIVLVFEAGRDDPLFVFKSAREGDALDELEKEHRVLSDLHACAPAGFRDTLPRPVARGELPGMVGYLTAALPGTRLKDLPPRRVFGPSTAGATLRQVVEWLADYHETADAVCRDEPVAGRRELFEAPAEQYLKWFRLTAGERELVSRSVERLPDPGSPGLPLCRGHGDFSPANVLWDDGRIGVVDFEYALQPCLPLDDLFHFLASMKSSTSARGRERARRGFFEETFYASGHVSRASRAAVHDLAGKLGVDLELVEALFVTAWVRYAVRSVELRIRDLDLASLSDDPDRLWQRLDAEPEEFLPVVRIGGGICGNVRQHVEMRDRFVLAKR